MQKLHQIFQFFIYSNIFISCCAALMSWETAYLFLGNQQSTRFLLFVFFATLCSYSFHWWLTPLLPETSSGERAIWIRKNQRAYPVLLGISAIGTIITALFLLEHWLWLLIAGFITFLYSAPKIPVSLFAFLKRIAIGKTIFLAMVWTFVTVGLPLLINRTNWHASIIYFFFSRFFVIYAICIIFDFRDKDYDKSIGVRSLIIWLSTDKIRTLFFTSVVLHFLATMILSFYAFPISTLLLLVLPAIITASLYSFATRHFSDKLYYFILDGLMALPAFVLFIIWLTQIV